MTVVNIFPPQCYYSDFDERLRRSCVAGDGIYAETI